MSIIMNSHTLPKHIQPLELAIQHSELTGTILIAEMPRLMESLATSKGDVRVELQFGKDEEGHAYLIGSMKTTLKLKCQRCLQPMELEVDNSISLGIVHDEQASKALPANYEPLLMEAEPMSLAEIIENELLLQLPLVAKHSAKECTIDLQKFSKTGNNDAPKKPNPFQVLEKLKGKDK